MHSDTKRRSLLTWEMMLLFLIVSSDMLSTLYWVHHHTATEGNPVMAYWLRIGDWAFILFKMMTILPFLALAAYVRTKRPRFIKFSLRFTLLAYGLIYFCNLLAQVLHS